MLTRERRAEAVMAAGLVAVAAAFLSQGWRLEPGLFEPIGSGTVPNAVAAALIVLTLAMLGESAWRSSGADARERNGESSENWLPMLAVFALTVVYVLVLVTGFVRYRWATLVYLPAAILLLSDRPRAALPAGVATGAVFAFGLDALFRHVLVTDLP